MAKRTYPDIRPSAESVWTSRRTSWRVRMKSARVCRIGRQPAAGGLLDPHRLDGPVQVLDAGSLGHVLQRDDEVGPDRDLGHDPVELVGERRPGVTSVHVDRSLEGLTTFDGCGQQGQRVGQLLLEHA